MWNKLLRIIGIWSGILILMLLVFLWSRKVAPPSYDAGEQLVAVNEIQQLVKKISQDNVQEQKLLSEKCDALKDILRSAKRKETSAADDQRFLWKITISTILMVLGLFLYLTRYLFKPMNDLKQYADRIANGDLDFPLPMDRAQYYSELTWAFDAMRCEIQKARASEKEQIENNKTVIATLSHDIKTPIASIRAYAEGLEAGLDESMEQRAKYTAVIMRKCDEVSKLTDDLFLHSLSNLDKLEVQLEKTDLSHLLADTVEELSGTKQDVTLILDNDPVFVMLDPKRMVQIIENLVNNARKYAKSEIEIHLSKDDSGTRLVFRDYGPGIPDEDMPFITQKFYRGRNCGKENGSGLGLYIVSYLVHQMNGKMILHNQINGLEITLILP